jgi:hypothetical protein
MARRFLSWSEQPLRGLARPGGTVVGGRLQGTAPVAIRDLDSSTIPPRQGAGPFELLGPGDVARLAPGAITRRYPAPGATDAEETKAALVELQPDDLPWRYAAEIPGPRPLPVAGQGLRPWLVLVAGTRGGDELTLSPDGRVGLGASVQAAHPLAESWRWAHVHEVDGRRIARILCPRDLAANSDYTACLVPAFAVEDGRLEDAWAGGGGGVVWLPCYDAWSFRTGAEGDFPQLAARLHVAQFAAGSDFGLASVRYERRGPGAPERENLRALGALRRPSAADPAPAEDWVADEVAALTAEIAAPDGRWILTSPRYDAPFTASAAEPSDGWARELRRDPRRRGAAGLGAWSAIAWQDRIAAAAAAKAGDLATARDRVGHLALGLEAARSLWRRRVPTDPVAALAVLGPTLGRLPSASGGTVLDAVAGRTPLFARALWSSAARRALRPGPARTSVAEEGAGDFNRVLRVARECPEPVPDPAELPLRRRDANFDRASLEWRGLGREDLDDLRGLIDELGALTGERRRACEEVQVDRLGEAVAGAVDPTVARPVVVDRVLGTLDGVDDIGPVELEPELDLPLWRFLATAAPDWLLPGVGQLQPDAVVGLATNPAFVQSLLVGANHQTTAELRFRNLPLRPRWSPLRKFWERVGPSFDVSPLRDWPAASRFGGAGLEAGQGVEAVVLFRSTIFARYPGTVVYLYPAGDPPVWEPPDETRPFLSGDRVNPRFTGRLADDLVLFGFPVAPAALATHWVVLEEPPSGYRFYLEDPASQPEGGGARRTRAVVETDFPAAAGATTAAEYGYATFAVPVRVMIAELVPGDA